MSGFYAANHIRALVAGGSEQDRSLYCELFKTWNIDICATACLEEAVKVVDMAASMDLKIDLILIDQDQINPIQLKFIQNLREHYSKADTKIVAIGSDRFLDHCHTQFSSDVATELEKPCAPSKLEETISVLLTKPEETLQEQTAHIEPKQAREFGIDVLIAEDNDVNQIVFTEILTELGVSFKIANNGREAVELWKRHNPAIIMMDVSMPVMNGHEATIEIRSLEEALGHHTPICAITAHALKGDKEDCLAAGMDDYLTKPVSPDMMSEKIRHLLPTSHPLNHTNKSAAAA